MLSADNLDPDQAPQNVGLYLDPNCLTLWWYCWNSSLKKKWFRKNQQTSRNVFLRKNRCLPPFDVKSMSHYIQFQTETLNNISIGNSSNFMQTISSYLVKISVNVVNNCTIITWYKIVIDNCFCDGQSSKGNNSKRINDRVTIIALCTSTHVGWYLYKVSWI